MRTVNMVRNERLMYDYKVLHLRGDAADKEAIVRADMQNVTLAPTL